MDRPSLWWLLHHRGWNEDLIWVDERSWSSATLPDTMTNFLYRHPRIYRWAMRALYGREFLRGLRLVAKAIDPGWAVLDVCAGDAVIVSFLPSGVRYTAWDSSPMFVRWACRRGIDAHLMDVARVPWPDVTVDCVIMIRSLYHFIPHETQVIDEMVRAATCRVVICEPVRNLSSSPNPFIRGLARRVSRVGKGSGEQRFSPERFRALLDGYGACATIEAGKDMVGIIDVS